jgi:sugar/nucleoside kinase (ribokinase family)
MIVVVNADPINIVSDLAADDPDTAARTSPVNVALALAGLRQPVALLAFDGTDQSGRPPCSYAVATRTDADGLGDTTPGVCRWIAADAPEGFASPTVAVHAGMPTFGSGAGDVEQLCDREHTRAQVTVSLDLSTRPDVADDLEAAQAWALRRIRSADVVTANTRDLAYLYPGVPATAIAHYWREQGVACSAITSDRDGVLLLAANGLAYRRTMPVESTQAAPRSADGSDGAFTAGLLAELSAIGALGSSPHERLADVRPQQWLRVLERADSAARSHAVRVQSGRRSTWPARGSRPIARRHAMAQA